MPPKKGRSVRREEHRQRPSSRATGQHLMGALVDLVEVRPLLPVDLYIHEQAVHHCRGVGVLERLMCHHMAPVARRIADGQEDRFVLIARQRLASSHHGHQSTGLSACCSR